MLDEITPKIQALQDFVNDMFEDVTGKIKDLKDSDEGTLALLRRVNSTIMSKEEQDDYFKLLVSVVATFLNYDNGKTPPLILEAFESVLEEWFNGRQRGILEKSGRGGIKSGANLLSQKKLELEKSNADKFYSLNQGITEFKEPKYGFKSLMQGFQKVGYI